MSRVVAVIVALLVIAGVAAAQQPAPSSVERGQAAFKNNGCFNCHMIGGVGTPLGPDLSAAGRKYPEEYLLRWLRDPALQRPTAHMPAFQLTEADLQALAAYLGSLR